MEITREKVIPLLLEACPSFQEKWDEYVNSYLYDKEGFGYTDATQFAIHIKELLNKGRTEEFKKVFAVIEQLHLNGDNYVKELATIGYLEDIQNYNNPEKFIPYLGPESLKWWNHLNDFWSGEAPQVGVSWEELAKERLVNDGIPNPSQKNIEDKASELKKSAQKYSKYLLSESNKRLQSLLKSLKKKF